MDLVREILIQIEASEKPFGSIEITVPDVSREDVSYHIEILSQAGLITADNNSNNQGYSWIANSLTWAAHDFLDSARNKSNWEKAKEYITLRGAPLTIEALKITFSTLLKKQLE